MRSVRYVRAVLLVVIVSVLSLASAQEEGFTITGTISNWPGGEAEVRAEQHNPTSPQVRDDVATGIIADDGSFEITLPPTSTGLLQSLLVRTFGGCEDVTVTPPTTRFSWSDLVVYRDGEALADLDREPAHDGAWFPPVGSRFVYTPYYSNDATIQANCEGVDGTIMDIEVMQGWNAVVWTVTEIRWPEEPYMTREASVGGGEDVPWVMMFRGRIGVNLEPNEENSGVVTQVAPGSPAQQAGLLPGDVIVEVDGQDVRGQNPISLIRGEPGTTVALGVMREGEAEPVQLEVTRGRL